MANCPYCGTELPVDSIFCTNCGKKVPDNATTQAQNHNPEDPRVWHCTFPSIFGFPAIKFSGIPKWSDETINSMTTTQLTTMLQEIKAIIKNRTDKLEKARALKQECKQLTEAVVQNKRKANVFQYITIASISSALLCVFMGLVVLYSFSSVGPILLLFNALSFIVSLILFIVNKSRHSSARKAYNTHFPVLNQELDEIFFGIQQDVYNHGDDYVSAIAALPSYWSDLDALDYFINALQNHRALTLGDAINLFEKDQNDKRLQSIMYQQLAAQRETAAAARETAYNTKVAAMATVDVSHNTRNIARSASDIERSNRKAAESAKEIAKNSEDIAQDTWAMRKGLD